MIQLVVEVDFRQSRSNYTKGMGLQHIFQRLYFISFQLHDSVIRPSSGGSKHYGKPSPKTDPLSLAHFVLLAYIVLGEV
jgi:hypothetical protein